MATGLSNSRESALPDATFSGVAKKMPDYFAKLEQCPPIKMDTREERRTLGNRLLADAGIAIYKKGSKSTDPGIYVLYEGCEPMYVGRSDRLKNRLLSHGQLSGGSETATFAFILAKKAFNKDDPMRSGKLTRPQLQKDPKFIALFDVAKTRVRKMLVRAVGIEDPIEQTIFEVYAHLNLRTPHNDFNNH